MNPSLNELVLEALRQLEKTGFAAGTINNSRKVFNRLLDLAAKSGEREFNEELAAAFNADSLNSNTGEYCHTRFRLHNQAIARLREIKENGAINWENNFHIKRTKEIPSGPLFKQCLEAYLTYLKEQGKQDNTIVSYRNVAVKFLLFCEASDIQRIGDIAPTLIPLFFQELSTTWAPTSTRTSTAALRSFLRFANASKATLRVIPQRCPRKTEIISSLSESQKNLLWKYLGGPDAKPRDKAMVALMLVTGLRPSDVLKLKLEDIKWRTSTISLIQQKTGKPLTLPMVPIVGNALMDYICNHRPRVPYRNVFLKSTAPYSPMNDHAACYAIVKKSLEMAGVVIESGGCGSRLLRRSSATNLLQAGIRLSDISAAMGHAKQETTEIYLSADEETMRQCVLPLPSGKESRGDANELG